MGNTLSLTIVKYYVIVLGRDVLCAGIMRRCHTLPLHYTAEVSCPCVAWCAKLQECFRTSCHVCAQDITETKKLFMLCRVYKISIIQKQVCSLKGLYDLLVFHQYVLSLKDAAIQLYATQCVHQMKSLYYCL